MPLFLVPRSSFLVPRSPFLVPGHGARRMTMDADRLADAG